MIDYIKMSICRAREVNPSAGGSHSDTPAMVTRDKLVIQQDCLRHLVQD